MVCLFFHTLFDRPTMVEDTLQMSLLISASKEKLLYIVEPRRS